MIRAKDIPAFFPKTLYKARARIEQAVGKLKRFKRFALRCEKTAKTAVVASQQAALRALQASKLSADAALQAAQAALDAEQALVDHAAQPVTDMQTAIEEVKLWAF
jgi:hypothetical protein